MPPWLQSLFANPTSAPNPNVAGQRSLNTPRLQHPFAQYPDYEFFGKPLTASNVDEASALIGGGGGGRQGIRRNMRAIDRRQSAARAQFGREPMGLRDYTQLPTTADRYIPPRGIF